MDSKKGYIQPLGRLCGLILFFAVPAGAFGQWSADLFRFTEPREEIEPAGAVVAARAVEIDTWLLDGEPERLTFELFDGRLYQAQRTAVERRGRRNMTWRGRLENGGSVLLTLMDRHVAGVISAPGATYRIDPRAEEHSLEKVDFGRLPGCGVESESSLGSDFPGVTECSASVGQSVVDLLTLYTKTARQAQGGQGAIRARQESEAHPKRTTGSAPLWPWAISTTMITPTWPSACPGRISVARKTPAG